MSDYLPDEVLIEILHRLSVKSLIRLRCVSKSWKSLITNPAFIDSHLTHALSSNSNKLIVNEDSHGRHYKFIHDDNNDSSFHQFQNVEFPLTSFFDLIGSVNGLFCLFEDERFILWNPCIRKFIILRKTYGPLTCHSGLGFDSRTNDYKVMRIAFPYNTNKCLSTKYNTTNKFKEGRQPLVEVYSLKEGTWRKISAGASLSPEIMFETQCGWEKAVAFINGAVHFQVSYNDGLKVCPFVLSFDFSEEVFHRIALPEAKVRAKNEFHIYGFRGSLSLVFNELVDNKRRYSIWVMKEYGIVKSWTELFIVDLSGYIRRVFGFMENGHVLFGKQWRGNYESDDTELSSYDPESQQVKKLGIPGWTVHFCTDNYVENLVLLDKPNVVCSQWVVSRKRKFRLTSNEEQRVRLLQKARHQLQETIQEEESLCQLLQPILHQQEAILHQLETILIMTLQEAMMHDERECQPQEALLCQQETLLQQRMDEIAFLISKVEKMDTVKSEWVYIIQQLRGHVITSAEEETILQQKMEKMTSLKSQLERMDTIKSKVVFFIQQFRGQAGDMSSGAGDQSSTQVQQRSSSYFVVTGKLWS